MAYVELKRSAFDDPRLRAVADHLRDQLNIKRLLSRQSLSGPERLPLADAARIASMSPEAFCRHFHEETGVYFHHWQCALRTEAAAQLILQGSPRLPIAVVGIRVGYKNESSFCRVFKTCEGVAPGTLRKLVFSQPELKALLRFPLLRRLFVELVTLSKEDAKFVSVLCCLAERLMLLPRHG
jgi:AraC-like DNA-binding protein